MEWVKKEDHYRVPIKSWCRDTEESALSQAADLAVHPAVFSHVALMPDCHQGYGMPIGGVIGCEDAVIPNAVGVDIGCGMGAVQTSIPVEKMPDMRGMRAIVEVLKGLIPCGEGNAHKQPREWDEFDAVDLNAGWYDKKMWILAHRNLGTLGGGNHFIEIQAGDDSLVWLMLHSGSRNLGYRIANYYNELALALNTKWHSGIPNKDLAFLPADSAEGQAYIRDMNFALRYAQENRFRMMEIFKMTMGDFFPDVSFLQEINIHHNYANLEEHFGRNVWVHRKGATAAWEDQTGIIPGSMGTPSYIVKGLGNPDSFMSCSHGAGRVLGRNEAARRLTVEACEKAMEGIVHDRWNKIRQGKLKGQYDLGEAPAAYKDIEDVIQSELDLIRPLVKLRPLAVIKG
jgi:tRNA-splicing ligase RtcB